MDHLLVRISKEYERLEEHNKNDRLLNYGRCDSNHHFIPQYVGLKQDYLPSSIWNGSILTLPWYLSDLKFRNKQYELANIYIK